MERKKYMIQVYLSFVTSSHLYIKGRVLKNRFPMNFANQGPISSMFNTILRARSKEIPDIPIRCGFGEHNFDVMTDCEGYFEVFQNISTFASIPKKIKIQGELKGGPIVFDRVLSTYLYDVPEGIISDIDDTLMVSKVRSFFKLKLLVNSVFINPFRRKPIENAAEALHRMLKNTEGQSPMIYLSNSPWNIYDYLQDFLLYNAFPIGELLLRDMGFRVLRSKEINEYNKFIEIEKLLIAFKNTIFTLIGDTGEKDFDIYKTIMEKYPDRIKQIILNDAGNQKKIEEVKAYVATHARKNIHIVKGYCDIENIIN